MASMITTGSRRGKCSVRQASHTRFQPPQASRDDWPQAAQKPCRRRQSNRDLAVPAMAASGPGSSAAASRISWNWPTLHDAVIPQWLGQAIYPISKTELAPLRLLHVLALAACAALLVIPSCGVGHASIRLIKLIRPDELP